MPSVWHAAHLRVSHIQGLHPCVPSPPRHNALAAAHRPRALASALRLQPRCAQSAPLASSHLPPPLAQVMILGSLTTFSLAFSTPVPRLPSSSTQGLRFDRARVLLLSAAWAWARHGLEVYGAACLLFLFRGSYPVSKSSTNCRSDHARAGPSAGAGPAPVGRPAAPAPPRLQTQAHTPRYRSHESPTTAPALTVTLQSPSATAKLPDQPSNPPQATAPSFSLVGPASLSRSNRRGLAVVRWK